MENTIKSRIRWDLETYINKVNEVHDNFYNYDKTIYLTLNHKIIINCPIHGDFMQLANQHIKGHTCPKCALEKQKLRQKDTTERFIIKAKNIHGDTYDYSKTIYGDTAHNEVTITCKEHGDFNITPNRHLSKKSGCQKCGKRKGIEKLIQNQKSSWKKSDWIEICEDKIAILYVVRMYNNFESFYKIGITSKSTINRRFTSCPYNIEVVKIIKSNNASFIYDLEKILLRATKHLRYSPKIKFAGYTECREVFDINEYGGI